MYFALGFPLFFFCEISNYSSPQEKRDKGNGRFADHWDLLVRVFVCPAYTAQCTVYRLDSKT
jgi:hypothetical protein